MARTSDPDSKRHVALRLRPSVVKAIHSDRGELGFQAWMDEAVADRLAKGARTAPTFSVEDEVAPAPRPRLAPPPARPPAGVPGGPVRAVPFLRRRDVTPIPKGGK